MTAVVAPQLVRRPAGERFLTRLPWLDSRHTFSFGEHMDPRWMGFRALRVINEDRVAPGGGFPTHSHRDMEIITYVLEGALEHRDSLGNGSVIRPGDAQRMSAGSGIAHSEYNASGEEPVHFLQIWVIPDARGRPASYAQARLPEADGGSRLDLLAAADGGAVTVGADVKLWRAVVGAGEALEVAMAPGRHLWVQAARGSVQAGSEVLKAGDGVGLSGVEGLELRSEDGAEALLFDLA